MTATITLPGTAPATHTLTAHRQTRWTLGLSPHNIIAFPRVGTPRPLPPLPELPPGFITEWHDLPASTRRDPVKAEAFILRHLGLRPVAPVPPARQALTI